MKTLLVYLIGHINYVSFISVHGVKHGGQINFRYFYEKIL